MDTKAWLSSCLYVCVQLTISTDGGCKSMAQVPYLLGTAMDVYAWDEASIIPFSAFTDPSNQPFDLKMIWFGQLAPSYVI